MKFAVTLYVFASALTTSISFIYNAPENCNWKFRGSDQKDVTLSCNLRTISSDFDSNNFSISQSERTTELEIICSDVLFFQSTLQPRVFQRLFNLDSISIQYCKLTSITAGTFLGLDAMKTLTVRTHNSDWTAMALELSSDSLVGMPHLESLNLGQNNIWNLPERVFCPLPALRHLNLTWNRLQDVSEIGVTGRCGAHLVTLDLSGNDLVVLPESGLAGLEALRELHLQYNDISMLDDGAFMGLGYLNVLNISSNRLVAVPPDVFNESLILTELYLQNNSINILAPGLFGALSYLTVLDISTNELTSEWVTSDTFLGLVRLIFLNLSRNRLSQVNLDMFRDLSALQVLDLSHNQLGVIGDMTFSTLANLHRLDLNYNKLVGIEGRSLMGLHVLSSLSVANNNISHIASDAFDNCTHLHDLCLNHNCVQSVPEALKKVENLRTLRISNNEITSVSVNDFSSLIALRHLDLSNNSLKGLCKSCLSGLAYLEVLHLSHNKLGLVPHGVFDSNKRLQLLRMDGNKMSDVNGLFASLSNLLWLNVSNNAITWFDYALIPNQLQYLDLHDNRIRDLGNYYSLEGKLDLRTLDVSHNQIETLNGPSVPDSIELLFVNGNKITEIGAGTFAKKHNLSMVDLFDNLLSKVDLNSINLPAVPDDRNLPEFYIGGNPIFCDCNMEWIHRVHQISGLRQHPRVMDLDKVMCTLPYPRSEENRIPFLETQAFQFLCPYASHCFALCKCCDFIACDCQMTCPKGCSCYHDDTWATNIIDCSNRNHQRVPDDIPMDATDVFIDNNVIPTLDAHHFIGRKNLRSLYINSSRVEKIQNRTFHGLSSLNVLNLQDNMLTGLSGYEFDQLEHLRELYLQNNMLKVINNATFSHMKALEVLRLDGNFIFNFPVWNLKINSLLKHVALSVNSWSCECQYMVDFKNWLIREKAVVHDSKNIFCVSNSSGDQGPSVLEISYSCEKFVATSIVQEKLENDFLQPVLITLGIFFGLIVMGIVFAIFRVRLQQSVSKRCGLKCFPFQPAPPKDDDKNLLYDAFISYSELDAPFITEVFAAELENGDPSYKLCLSSRDYQTVGTYVGDFIVHSVESSLKTVLVLTKHFIDHDWCKFSFKAAHLEALKDVKNCLIVVICGDLNENEMDSDLLSLVKNSTKLKYGDKSFWSKLHASLPSGAKKISEQCYISETNYVMSNSMSMLSPSHTLKQGQLVPTMVLTNAIKTPIPHYHPQQSLHPNHHRLQPSLSSDHHGELEKNFVSVETAHSSLAPSLSHSYMSLDYRESQNSHIYASIDETSPALPLPTLPSVHTLHSHLHQQQPQQEQQHHHHLQHQQSPTLPHHYLPISNSQQRRPLTQASLQTFSQPHVSASYFI